jgi:hypothetical protein
MSFDRQVEGRAEVLAAEQFGAGALATLLVVLGSVRPGCLARLLRGGRVVASGLRLYSHDLRAGDTGVAMSEACAGELCATIVEGRSDVRIGDVLETLIEGNIEPDTAAGN